jgi:LysR family hydrogen peroxide-inducible transcriptional activator
MAKRIKGSYEGTLSLGVIPTVAPSLLPRFIPEFKAKFPNIVLKVEELKTEDMIDALRKDQIDVGIAATPLNEKGIVEQPLYWEPFMAFVPNYHPMKDDKFLLASEINVKDLLLLNEGHCFRNSVLKLCQANTQESQGLQMESGNFDTLVKLAHRGMGMTLLPYLTAVDLHDKYKPSVKPIAKPTPGREISLLFARTQLKVEWIEAMGALIKEHLPKKVLSKPDQIVSP